MAKEKCTLTHLDVAAKAAKRAYHKNGPKSYCKGQGALLKVLHKADGTATRDELIERLGFSRRELKGIVRKAERNGFAKLEGLTEGGYKVVLSPEGDAVAEKRCAAQAKVAEDVLSCLSAEEVAQLDALLVKIADSCGGAGKRPHGKRHHRVSRGHRRCGCRA